VVAVSLAFSHHGASVTCPTQATQTCKPPKESGVGRAETRMDGRDGKLHIQAIHAARSRTHAKAIFFGAIPRLTVQIVDPDREGLERAQLVYKRKDRITAKRMVTSSLEACRTVSPRH
jgi:hypothetical protein